MESLQSKLTIESLSPWDYSRSSLEEAFGLTYIADDGETDQMPDNDAAAKKVKKLLIAIAKGIDSNKEACSVMILPSNSPEQPGIYLEILSPPLTASSEIFSYCGDSSSSESATGGPIIPVRYANRDNFHLAAAMMMILMKSDSSAKNSLYIEADSVDDIAAFNTYIRRGGNCISEASKQLHEEAMTARNATGIGNAMPLFEYSFLFVPGKNGPDPSKNNVPMLTCAYAGCKNPGSKLCSRCGTGYCSTEHQKLDWKAVHKSVCNARQGITANSSTTTNYSLNPYYNPIDNSVFLHPDDPFIADNCTRKYRLDMDATIAECNRSGIPIRERSLWAVNGGLGITSAMVKRLTSKIPFREGKFVVKASLLVYSTRDFPEDEEIILGGQKYYNQGRINIYDERRTFILGAIFSKNPTDPGFMLGKFMRKQGRHIAMTTISPKMECCLYARTEGGGLRIYLDRMAPMCLDW